MKKILVTGKSSYIGNQFEQWIATSGEKFIIDKIRVRNDEWKEIDFSIYDTVLHLAGIAHVSKNPKMEELYYRVNRNLTIALAEKAKAEGVKQFIFMSSIIVYGEGINDQGFIDKNTVPQPSNFYGESKLQAENGIIPLKDESFKIVIIRPPMIYGENSKGNYPKLAKTAKKLPIFPDIDNQRSMLYIDNLCEFIKLMIVNEEQGIFFPQNKEYVKTSELTRTIAEIHGKKMMITTIFNPAIKLMIKRVGIINKVFGDLVYKKSLSEYKENYTIYNLEESIKVTELGKN